ncbi:MAG: glycerophosphoryl diester phosphodiesterase membrane domain-containing protein [Clostridia bacterium]|nr:glycerophosphoryl diester phosphodiesterase membrane domain-containing protein [Clostridia bacterium]
MMKRLQPYIRAVPSILLFNLIISAILFGTTTALKALFNLLIWSTGRVAVSTGDMAFLFTTPQGWLVILLGLLTLMVYVTLEINTMVLFSQNLLHGVKRPMLTAIKEAIRSFHKMLKPRGLIMVLYIALIFPLIGVSLSISITSNLYIPHFIQSVIDDNIFFSTGYTLLMIVLFVVFVMHIFALHGLLSPEVADKEAMKLSRRMVRKNLGSFLLQNLLFMVVYFAIAALIIALTSFVPYIVIDSLGEMGYISGELLNGFGILFAGIILIEMGVTVLLFAPLYIMKLTMLFEQYRTGEAKTYTLKSPRGIIWFAIVAALCIGVVALLSFTVGVSFDNLMPHDRSTGIIAHRAGGFEAPENTVAALKYSIEKNVVGGEIDIQRTKDGYYVVNHDADFERVAGDSRIPSEMTLEEVKQLKVEGKEPVATLEEMLDASKGHLTLYVELKGETADRQMADDAVRIIKEKGMEKEAVIISLKYDLIDYIEKNYNEMLTAYLCFASFGDTAMLNCDYLGIEEESATDTVIESIHKQGKKIMVWTPNAADDQRTFLKTDADAIITDNITQAEKEREQLDKRNAYERTLDRIFDIVRR